MNRILLHRPLGYLFQVIIIFSACQEQQKAPSKASISALNLKTGALISCGPSEKQFGSVSFETSCKGQTKDDFLLGLKLLHSFEYDEAEKVFAEIIKKQPDCAMAYWGVAMSNFHPLWTPPTEPELKKGSMAISIAKTIKNKSVREQEYIDAVAAYYNNWHSIDHKTRCLLFEEAVEKLHKKNPADKESAIFYALALNAAADPADKTYKRQKKAGSILSAIYPQQTNHPGIVHYLIHTYDYPELATLALPAARKYAAVAPSSAHALHMPSHIFTRLGLWEECIKSNLASVSSAQCYAQAADIKGHWDEELHALDYLVYAYLQQGDNVSARKELHYLSTIKEVHPTNFKVAYAFAAIPARYVLENRMWKEASTLNLQPGNLQWKDYPWQQAIIHFTRSLGNVHTGNLPVAKAALKELYQCHALLQNQKDAYKANQVQIQIKASEAWIQLKEGNAGEALLLMNVAADLEDQTGKHPVTPCEVVPARELLSDMLLQLNHTEKALQSYEATLKKHPNRFNSLYGAGLAAEKSGNIQKAKQYYGQLLSIANPSKSERPELKTIKQL